MNITKLEPEFRLKQYLPEGKEHEDFYYRAGEHYVFLMTVAKQFNNTTIYDLGTYVGQSAVALSANLSNRVISYDIQYVQQPPRCSRPDNVEFRLGNCFDDLENMLKSPLIFMDVDPHDGVFDDFFYKTLVDNKYKGTVILDDIHLNEPMRKFWANIKEEKIDYTHLGHWSGTGIVLFK